MASATVHTTTTQTCHVVAGDELEPVMLSLPHGCMTASTA